MPEAVKLKYVPGRLGGGISFNRFNTCGERRSCGIRLPANGVRPTPVKRSPVCGSKIWSGYSLKSPLRAKAVGTVVRTDRPTQRAAELVPQRIGDEFPGERASNWLRKGIARGCLVVAPKQE